MQQEGQEPSGDALDGVAVLVTRPASQAEPLCRLIEEQGGTALRFPTLEILEPSDPLRLESLRSRLASFHIAIFVSANAVRHGLRWLAPQGIWPAAAQIAAIGAGTARELRAAGIRADILPEGGFDSESLLAQPALREVAGKGVLLVRGEGGRELLAEVLQDRGARVEYAEVYRRGCPRANARWLVERARRSELHALISTSHESLLNLLKLWGEGERPQLLRTPLFVIGDRQAALARGLGFERVFPAAASDAAIVEAIKTWRHGA